MTKLNVTKEWCLEMALREGEREVGAGARHEYLVHETIEALIRCPLCAALVRAALEAPPTQHLGPWHEEITVNDTTTIADGAGRFIYLRPSEVPGVLTALNALHQKDRP